MLSLAVGKRAAGEEDETLDHSRQVYKAATVDAVIPPGLPGDGGGEPLPFTAFSAGVRSPAAGRVCSSKQFPCLRL